MASASLKSIEDILNETFIVKTYQRGYRWEKTEIEELLIDLDKFQAGLGDSIYCLQPIVVKKDGEKYELVDGQQRLTALWLIKKYHEVFFHSLGETYSLEYEGKDSFTRLLQDVEDLCGDNTKTPYDLLNLVDCRKNESIDAYMFAESIRVMRDFKVGPTKLIHAVLSEVVAKLKYVCVIWYELDANEDPIVFFTNLNANKVPLTDAELIKATIYHAAPPTVNEKIVNEWQEIEKKLHDEELWHFVTYDANKAVRIEYLFEVWCCAKGLPIEPQEKNPVFHAVNDQLASDKITSKELWNEIKAVYEALVDWKNGYYTYHVIGFLTLVYSSKEKNVNLIKELYEYYRCHKKSEFREELKKRVKDLFIGRNRLATKVDKSELFDGINDLRYNESNSVIKVVLQFYNIALLLEANNQYEWFPFKALKVSSYDIEHVNSQTPDYPDYDSSEKKEWLQDHKKYSSLSEELVNEIDNCIVGGLIDFDSVANKIRAELGLDDHSIGNLVLLDSGLNRSYKNVCFARKRQFVVEKLRGRKNVYLAENQKSVVENKNEKASKEEETPILPGTKWVFLKEYDAVDTNKIWTKSDVNTYIEDIGKKIYEFLK